MRKQPFTIYAFAVLPWLFIVSLLAFYLHASCILGYLPVFDHPDPKELSIYRYYGFFVYSSSALAICSFIPWIVILGIHFIRDTKEIKWYPVCIGSTGYFLAILLFFSDILEWFAD